MTEPFFLLAAGFFGLCIGSFLNVVIYRLPLGQSLATPPSRCRNCGYSLRWFDNIPVLSWTLLRGRCRKCGVSVSWQYPVVELITGALFVLVVWLTPIGPLVVSRLLFVSVLIALFGIDLEHQILPDQITLPGIVIGLLLSLIAPPGFQDALIGTALGAGIILAIFYLYLWWRGVEGMGMGDMKMLAMIGAFLGWKAVLATLVLSSVTGSIVAGMLMATKRGNLGTALPYGTFLALAATAAMFVADPFLSWYLNAFWTF